MAKTTLIALILLVFAIPVIQKYSHLPSDYKLDGYTEPVAKPQFSFGAFFSGAFQEQLDAYLQENVGFKGYLIALKNQIDYSLFNKLNYTIEVGDDGQLFYWNHIDTRCGHLTLTEDSLQKKAEEATRLKALLDSMHTKMLFVLAPGKPFFFDDKLPERFKNKCSDDNDYKRVLSLLQQNNLSVIDFNAWFKSIRATQPYPLFPKLGTHWSYYGATLATDSLAKYIERELNNDLSDYSVKSTEITAQAKGKDKDLYDLSNLLLPIQSDSLAYPEFTFAAAKGKKPKVLLIGDSFNWTLVDTKMLPQLFSDDSRFWFYKKQLYDLNGKWISENPDEVNLYELLKGTDIVIFLSTEALYHRFDHGLANAVFANPAVADSLNQIR
ncbi:MAG TPA: hypothetical protein VK154_07335 [Chitinophagales bacterium]|nr:hypothetical protein [Chitinophagales bacterium]